MADEENFSYVCAPWAPVLGFMGCASAIIFASELPSLRISCWFWRNGAWERSNRSPSNDGRSGPVLSTDRPRRRRTDSYVETSFGKQTVSCGGSIGRGALGGTTAIPCSRGTISTVDTAFMWSIFVVLILKMTHVVPLLHLTHILLAPIQHPPPNTSRPWRCIRNSNGREGNNGNGRPIAGIVNEEYYPRRYGGCARYLWLDVSHFGACSVYSTYSWALGQFLSRMRQNNVLTFPLTFYHSPPTSHLPPIARVLCFYLQCMCNSQW